MDHTCRAVFILEEDHSIPAGHKPLMLEAILHRPIMERAVVQCLADGVQRFFVVCSPRFAEEAAACWCPAGCRSSDRRPSLSWNRFWRRWNKNRNFEILNI